jgi:hypothetical protein
MRSKQVSRWAGEAGGFERLKRRSGHEENTFRDLKFWARTWVKMRSTIEVCYLYSESKVVISSKRRSLETAGRSSKGTVSL